MARARIIPVLLIDNSKLVKTVKFKRKTYIGDPFNAIKIFNDKEVDEVVVLDISASKNKTGINYNLLKNMAGECFMPLAYGGGIKNLDDAKKVFGMGAEKIILNGILPKNPTLITKIANIYGSQAVVASLDFKKTIFNNYVMYTNSGRHFILRKVLPWLKELVDLGIGEILINSISNDGMMKGYDMDLIRLITQNTNLPVIACGGAGNIDHLREAIKSGASAVAAGSIFVYSSKSKGILINYPSQDILQQQFYSRV